MKDKAAVSLSVGDRDLPLEADLDTEIQRDSDLVGQPTEVSPVAGGDLVSLRGKPGRILGVIQRFGVVVAYEVEVAGKVKVGSAKDFYVGREVLEDIQPPTATSSALRQALSHWKEQRTYWGPSTAGIESFMFALASATPAALVKPNTEGFRVAVPDPRGERAMVNCSLIHHDNFWTLGSAVYPERRKVEGALRINDHWGRVFAWGEIAAQGMVDQGFPWEQSLKGMRLRAIASLKMLRPLFIRELTRVNEAKEKLGMNTPSFAPQGMSIGFSRVRLKPGTIGLTEPPTDLRPYTVVSVSPEAMKSKSYLQQVVLHEAIHIGVGSRGGEPHNAEFNAIAEALGLEPKYRD